MNIFKQSRKRSKESKSVSASKAAEAEELAAVEATNSSSHVAGRLGLTILYKPDNPEIDVVFVHGLTGDSLRTWTAPNGECWPRDFLPHDLPKARILTYGYDSSYFSARFLMQGILWDQGTTLIHELAKARRQPAEKQRAIIFVAHSLGGIVVKSALIQADAAGLNEDDPTGAISRSTVGVVFFGTPHRGVPTTSWPHQIEKIVSIFTTKSYNLETLENRSEFLQTQLERFNVLSQKLLIWNFYETESVAVLGEMVVPGAAIINPTPTSMDQPLEGNHISMVKFSSPQDGAYKKILSALNELNSERHIAEEQWKIYYSSRYSEQTPSPNISEYFDLGFQPPFPRNPLFFGRETELYMLHEALVSSNMDVKSLNTVTISGLGGVGKTSLALEFAFRHNSDFVFIFWVRASSATNIYNDFRKIAQQILDHYFKYMPSGKIPVSAFPNLQAVVQHLGMAGFVDDSGHISKTNDARTLSLIQGAVIEWINRYKGTNWLLVLDDLQPELREILPHYRTLRGQILITTRSLDDMSGSFHINLGPLSSEEGLGMLIRQLGQEKDDYEQHEIDTAKEVVARLGGLPLALGSAAAFMRQSGISFEEFKNAYDKHSASLSVNNPIPWVPSGYSNQLQAVWVSALSQLPYDGMELLDICSCFDPDEIPIQMLEMGTGLSRPRLTFAISSLVKYQLIQRDATKQTLSIHRVIRWTVNDKQRKDNKQREITAAALMVIVRAANATSIDSRQDDEFPEFWKSLAPHILACMESMEPALKLPDIRAGDCYMLGKILVHEGHVSKAEMLYQLALADRPQDWPMTTFDTTLRLGLATLWSQQGRYMESSQLLNATLHRLPDGDYMPRGEIMLLLGSNLEATGDLSAAERVYRERLSFLPGDASTLQSANVFSLLAGVLHKQGRLDEAELLYQRAYMDFVSHLGKEDRRTLVVQEKLASVLQEKDRLPEAEALYLQLLEHKMTRLGSQHPDTLDIQSQLGAIWDLEGRHEEAEQIFSRVLVTRLSLLGLNDPNTLKSLENLGLCYHKQNNLALAEKIYLEALAGERATSDPDSTRILEVARRLGGVWKDQGKIAEAKNLVREVRAELRGKSKQGISSEEDHERSRIHDAMGDLTLA